MKAEFKLTNHQAKGVMLSVTGDLTVSSAKAWKEMLVELGATPQQAVTISLKEVAAMDVTALQLLYAFHQQWLKEQKKLSLEWPVQEAVDELMMKCGFKQVLRCLG